MCNLWACTQFRDLVPSLILFQIEELDILAVIHLSPTPLVLLFLCACSVFPPQREGLLCLGRTRTPYHRKF